MKKNLYLHDRFLHFLPSIQLSDAYQIKYASTHIDIVNNPEFIRNQFPVLKGAQLMSHNNHFFRSKERLIFDYELFEKFRGTQLKTEYHLDRRIDEHYLKEYMYYDNFANLYKIFSEGQIDLVLTAFHVHGHPLEIIPIDLARHFNIPVYTFDISFGNPNGYLLISMFNHNTQQFVEVPEEHKEAFDIEDYITRVAKEAPKGMISIQENIVAQSDKKTKIKYWLKQQTIYKYGFLYKLLIKLKLKEIRRGYKTLERTSAYYKKVSIKPDFSKKYIYYSLHFDPEATTLIQEQMASQLFIISSITQNLPEGWEVFVKEHPAEFYPLRADKLKIWSQYLDTMYKFRNTSFYDQINALDRVRLISLSYTAQELIEHSQAIATINGSVALEAMQINKPIILFGNKTPLAILKDIFKVNSNTDIETCLNKIAAGFTPDYSDKNIFSNYLFEINLDHDQSTLNDINNQVTKNVAKILKGLIN
jgi:hypothetical protein